MAEGISLLLTHSQPRWFTQTPPSTTPDYAIDGRLLAPVRFPNDLIWDGAASSLHSFNAAETKSMQCRTSPSKSGARARYTPHGFIDPTAGKIVIITGASARTDARHFAPGCAYAHATTVTAWLDGTSQNSRPSREWKTIPIRLTRVQLQVHLVMYAHVS